jgi:hypothetical protein
MSTSAAAGSDWSVTTVPETSVKRPFTVVIMRWRMEDSGRSNRHSTRSANGRNDGWSRSHPRVADRAAVKRPVPKRTERAARRAAR